MTKLWKRWTESDDQELRTLVKTSRRTNDIAIMLNRTVSSIRTRCSILNLNRNKVNSDKVIRLYSSGYNREEIARMAELSPDRVSQIVASVGGVLRRDLYTEEEIELIRQSEGTRTLRDLAKIIKRKSALNIYMKAHRMGVKLKDGRQKQGIDK